MVGLINPNWCFAALDVATHVAEEMPRPDRDIPRALIATVAIGFVTSWAYAIALLFCIQDVDAAGATPTLVPILEIFRQTINHAGAIAMEILILVVGIGCQSACHTWQSRLCWSFARDGGLPASKWLAKVDHHLDVPMRALAFTTLLDGLIGLMYLGSSAAFNS